MTYRAFPEPVGQSKIASDRAVLDGIEREIHVIDNIFGSTDLQ